MRIQICPEEVFTRLLYLIFILLFLNILGIISRIYLGHSNVFGLIRLFDFDTEGNIPTFYSASALLFSSILLFIIALFHKNNGYGHVYWIGLAIIFLFLSIDEISSIHEKLSTPIRHALRTYGSLYFGWIIPYTLFLIALLITYLKFLIRLPKKIRILFMVSGATFVMGAIGFEMLGGRYFDLYGNSEDIVFSILYTCEEFLEMLGVVLFIYTLLMYIVSQFESLTISVNKTPTQTPLHIK